MRDAACERDRTFADEAEQGNGLFERGLGAAAHVLSMDAGAPATREGFFALSANWLPTACSNLANSGRKPFMLAAMPSPRSRSSSFCSTHAPAVSSASMRAPSATSSVCEASCSDCSWRSMAPMPRAVQDPDKASSCGVG
jgi:hypothetical protein